MVVSLVVLVSIIIPAFNEEATIGTILRRILEAEITYTIEIVVVDDGSKDKTSEKARQFGVKLLRHPYNLGKGRALRTGMALAAGEIIVWQDADLEYFPQDIPRLLRPIIQGTTDVVYGSRFSGKVYGMSVSHFLGNKLLTWVTRILFNHPLTDMETGYKAFRREVIVHIELTSDGFEIEPEVTAKVLLNGFRITEVPITYRAREKRNKKISWRDGVRSLFYLFKLRFSK